MTNLATIDGQAPTSTQAPVSFVWLEITPNCQLTCEHCYVASRPGLGHGKLKVIDWKNTMDSLRSMGVQHVQFIGGEPTTHPYFCELVEYAAEQGFSIEVYTNLVGITQRMWDCFTRHHVRIATSFYSTEARIHDAITHLPGSYQKTLGNMKKVLALGLTLRVGIIHIREDQDIPRAEAFLEQLGVDPKRIGVDRVRGVGRGLNLSKEDAVSALCGKCVSGRCVITAEGTVYPCIMARSFPLGSVLIQNIEAILTGETFASTCETLNAAFVARTGYNPKSEIELNLKVDPPNTCEPDNDCGPLTPSDPCGPDNCGPDSKDLIIPRIHSRTATACNPDKNPCDPDCSPADQPEPEPPCGPQCPPADDIPCSPTPSRYRRASSHARESDPRFPNYSLAARNHAGVNCKPGCNVGECKPECVPVYSSPGYSSTTRNYAAYGPDCIPNCNPQECPPSCTPMDPCKPQNHCIPDCTPGPDD